MPPPFKRLTLSLAMFTCAAKLVQVVLLPLFPALDARKHVLP